MIGFVFVPGREPFCREAAVEDASAVKPPRGEYAKTRAKRQAIIDAAGEVFAAAGYRSGSLREIAARVGISEAGIFHHFSSKAKLLDAVLVEHDRRTVEFVTAGTGAAGALRRIARFAEGIPHAPGLVELHCIVSAEAVSPEHPAHQHFVEQRATSRDLIAGWFEQLDAEGRYRSHLDCRDAAKLFVAMFDGIQLHWLLDPGSVDVAGLARTMLSEFVDIDWDVDEHASAG